MKLKKKFLLTWDEEVSFNCSVYIEAESKEEAIKKWQDGEFGDYERDEYSNSFSEEVNIEEVDE